MDTLTLPQNKFTKVEATMPTHRSEVLHFLRTHGAYDAKAKLKMDGTGPYHDSPNVQSQ